MLTKKEEILLFSVFSVSCSSQRSEQTPTLCLSRTTDIRHPCEYICVSPVENLAFRKDSWINKKTLYKRHIRHNLPEGHADRAVDGNLDLRLSSCTILDNLYGKYPLWTVDLGQKMDVSGVVIYTWQGDGKGQIMSACLPDCLYVYLPVCLPVYFSACLHVCISTRLCACLSAC